MCDRSIQVYDRLGTQFMASKSTIRFSASKDRKTYHFILRCFVNFFSYINFAIFVAEGLRLTMVRVIFISNDHSDDPHPNYLFDREVKVDTVHPHDLRNDHMDIADFVLLG